MSVWILLPPSETKARGGGGSPLELGGLLFGELTARRSRLIDALAELAGDLPAARAALGVSAAKDAEVAANAAIRTAPTLPAIERYTGVLYDALDIAGMTAAQRARADSRIVVISALFGALRATDPIPAYRLSAASRLPGLGTIASWWKSSLAPLLAGLDAPVLDLRSGAYAAFAAIPGAITARVVTERPDGSRAVVSHHNKAAKGRLARIVATARGTVSTAADIVRLADAAGMRAEQSGAAALEIVT